MNYFARKKQEYQALDRLDRRRFWTDGLLNNALYILMAIFIIFTAVVNKNFLSPSSIVNIIMLAAVSLPMALGIGEAGEMMQGLALVNVGGLLASTCLSLLMLPVYYTIVNGNKKAEPDYD